MAGRPVLATMALVSLLGGCAGDGMEVVDSGLLAQPGFVTEVYIDGSPSADVTAPIPVSARREPSSRPYLLDTGDRLRLFVYGQPSLSRLYQVDQEGRISVPLIGPVRVRGLTTYAVEDLLRARLGRDLVRDPQVSVDVQQNRPFFIHGEVRSAGQFPYVSGMTVETAVAIAGGYSDRANERRVRISRRVDGATAIMEVPPDFELEPGDTVFVNERFL